MILRGPYLTCYGAGSLRYVPDGAVKIDARGMIEWAGPWKNFIKKYGPEKNLKIHQSGGLMVPGLVDAHCHLPQYAAVAMGGEELLPWLKRYIFPLEKSFEDPSWVTPYARYFFQEMIRNGTTTAAVYATIWKESTDLCFEEALKSGLRVIMGKVMMDRHSYNNHFRQLYHHSSRREVSLRESNELCRKWHGREGRVFYAFTPRFALSCSQELMKDVAQAARNYGAYIQTHLSENQQEIAAVKKEHPGYRSYTDLYHACGLLGPKTLLGHSVWLDQREMTLLGSSQSKVIHCPTSNFFLSSGIMNWRALKASRVSMALGSDVGAGPELNLWAVMKQALYADRISRSGALNNIQFQIKKGAYLRPQDVFYWATLGGAKALGLGRVTGSIEIGKSADFSVIDLDQVNPVPVEFEHLMDSSVSALLARLVFRGNPSMIRSVFVQGKDFYHLVDKTK